MIFQIIEKILLLKVRIYFFIVAYLSLANFNALPRISRIKKKYEKQFF